MGRGSLSGRNLRKWKTAARRKVHNEEASKVNVAVDMGKRKRTEVGCEAENDVKRMALGCSEKSVVVSSRRALNCSSVMGPDSTHHAQ